LIPKSAAAGFSERFDTMMSQWQAEKKERIYIFKKNDNLSNVAARFDVSVKAIRLWNGISTGKNISPGSKLFIFSSKFQQANTAEVGDTQDPAPDSP
jgi:LysM repeat protein